MRFSTKYAAGVGKPVKGQAGKPATEQPRKNRRREDLAREADRERGMAQGQGEQRREKGTDRGKAAGIPRCLRDQTAPAIPQAARQMGVDPVDDPSQ